MRVSIGLVRGWRPACKTALDEIQVAGQVTGMGSLHSLHFSADPVRDYRSMAASHAELQRLTHLGLLNRGIFTAKRNMFAVSTPMSEADIDVCVAAFADLLAGLPALHRRRGAALAYLRGVVTLQKQMTLRLSRLQVEDFKQGFVPESSPDAIPHIE